MRTQINMSKVVPEASIQGEDAEETAELKEMFEESRRYLEGFEWNRGITAGYFGLGVGGIVCVSLFEFEPARNDIPNSTWVVVGDLPSAHIAVDDTPNPASALDAYIGCMTDWVEAAKAGRSVAGLIPVNVPATFQNAATLESRLRFLDEQILSPYAEDLRE